MTFSIMQLLAVLGMAQSLLIIVYTLFRSGSFKASVLSLLFFGVLFLAFLSDFSFPLLQDNQGRTQAFNHIIWGSVVTFAALVMHQVVRMGQMPDKRQFLPAVIFVVSIPYMWAHQGTVSLFGVLLGAVALLSVWLQRQQITEMYNIKFAGKERYWLCMALFSISLVLLTYMIAPFGGDTVRGILGLGFVYLAGTVLFRIYPQAIPMHEPRFLGSQELSDAEKATAQKIEKLLEVDKVYQEQSYGRKDLARECGLSEAQISRITNIRFQKSLPQVLNEYRVNAAKKMLLETNEPIKLIAEIVGFNSLASFNRVFKETTGSSPTEFRTEETSIRQKTSSL